MNIVFPMAGESSRFFGAGYVLPKYMLPLGKNSDVLDFVLKAFLRIKGASKFYFICRDFFDTESYIYSKMRKYDIVDFEVICLNGCTNGQAATVMECANFILDNEPLLIFNIDTFHQSFEPVDLSRSEFCGCDGVLELFIDSGDNWSYAEVKGAEVIRTAEKQRISRYASNGLYYFRSKEVFIRAYNDCYADSPDSLEQFIAPMYNSMISYGGRIKYKLLKRNDMIFCGVPSEYAECLTNPELI